MSALPERTVEAVARDYLRTLDHLTARETEALLPIKMNYPVRPTLVAAMDPALGPDRLVVAGPFDELVAAVRGWLRFDNEVEPPAPSEPYVHHVRYETGKCAITERVAAALPIPSPERTT